MPSREGEKEKPESVISTISSVCVSAAAADAARNRFAIAIDSDAAAVTPCVFPLHSFLSLSPFL